MKLSCLLAAFSLLSLPMSGPQGSDDLTKVLKDYTARRNELFKNGSAKAGELDKIIQDVLSRVKLDELSPSDAARIATKGLLRRPANQAIVAKRMAAFYERTDLDGAIARAVALFLLPGSTAEDQKQQAEAAKALLNHPKLPELIRSPYGSIAVDALANAPLDEESGPKAASIAGMLTGAPHELADSGSSLWKIVKQFEKDPSKRQALRTQIADFMRSSIEKAKAANEPASRVDFLTGAMNRMSGKAAREELIGHLAPDMRIAWSSDPAIKSLGDLKGKVVVLDFWATWCGPCIKSFPKLKELQARYKGYPVAIIGVTSLQGSVIGLGGKDIVTKGDPASEYRLLGEYMKEKEMTWNVVFSQEDVFNPDFGVDAIPHVAVLDPEGKVRHSGLDFYLPLEKKIALIDSLLAEYKLKAPPK